MTFKGMTEFKTGSGFIWKRGQKVLHWSAEGAGAQAGQRNCQAKWKRIYLLRFSGSGQKMLT